MIWKVILASPVAILAILVVASIAVRVYLHRRRTRPIEFRKPLFGQLYWTQEQIDDANAMPSIKKEHDRKIREYLSDEIL